MFRIRASLVGLALLSACESAEEVPRFDGPALRGIVRVAGDAVFEPTRIENTTDPEVCGDIQTLEDVVVSESRGIRNVIVSVKDAPRTDSPPSVVVIDNESCRFEPHVAVMTSGSSIEARNSDAVLHTTHIYGPTEMNISLPVQDASAGRTLTENGIYSVKCDVHGWMQAYVRVDPHPFHAVTDSEGRFLIESLPPGVYTLELWHEKLGPLEKEVTVSSDETEPVEIEYTP